MRKKLENVLFFGIPNWLVLLLSGVFVLRIPSFFEPFFYGDEMIYLDLGEAVRRGMVLYRDIHDNKPPLLYYLAAVAGNVFWFRAILAFWMLITVILFWRLAKQLFKNQNTVKIATICFGILTSLPFFEGNTPNAELFMVGPIIGAFMLMRSSRNYIRNSILAGVLIAFASLFKIPSAFDGVAVVFVIFLSMKFNRKEIVTSIQRIIAFSLGFVVPLLITCIWYWSRGALNEYVVAAFLQNFGYVSSWRAQTNNIPFLVKNGPLIVRGLIMLATLVILFFLRKRRSKGFLIAVAWIATSLFAATLSERPYPHYFVQVLPPLSLLVGMLFADTTIEQSLTVLPLTLVFLVPSYYHFWQYSSSHYVGRFITLVQSRGGDAYFREFGDTVLRNYEIAEFISSHTAPTDRVFVWGEGSPLYALSKRLPPIKYVADYHIRDFSSLPETLDAIQKTRPKIIVMLPEAPAFSELGRYVTSHYVLIKEVEGASVWYNTKQ